jgi:hypothetical protein
MMVAVCVWTETLICTEVTVRTTGAVGQVSGVVVVFENPVGVGNGMEELPVGYGGVIVVLKGTLGVGDGTVVFRETLDVVPIVFGVKPLPEGAVELPNNGGTTGATVGGELVVALLEGRGLPDGGIRELVSDAMVVFAEGVIRVKIPELKGGPCEVELLGTGGTISDTVVTTTVIETPVGNELDAETVGLVPGTVEFNTVELKVSGVRSTSEFVNVEVDETLRLRLGVILARVVLLVSMDVDPLKNGVLSASELVNGRPVDDELKLGVGEALGVSDTGTEDVLTGTKNEEFVVGKMLPLPAVDDIVE